MKIIARVIALSLLISLSAVFMMPSAKAQSEPLRIGITAASFDDVGQIIRALGGNFEFITLTSTHFANLQNLSQFYAVFINCGSHGIVNSTVLRSYVYQGGIVYASDLAGDALLTAFPGRFSFAYGNAQTINNASIVLRSLAMHMGRNYIDVVFDQGGWYVVSQLTDEATVYIRGNVAGHGERPLAFSFDYGRGRVFYTSFHNHRQATGDMLNFIEYLVFRIQHIEAERVLQQMAYEEGYVFDGMVFGVLSHNEVSEAFYYTPQANDFMLLFDPLMGDFTIYLQAPTGEVFLSGVEGMLTEIDVGAHDLDLAFQGFPIELITDEMIVEGLGPRGFRVLNPVDGTWNFWVRSNNPEPELMFAVGLAERPTAALTRAMFTQVMANLDMVNLADFRDVPQTFDDVPRAAWFFEPVEWAAHNYLVFGVDEGRFSPNTPITREEMVVFLHRYALFLDTELPNYGFMPFTDQAEISLWAQDAITSLASARIVPGRADGSFDPHATATTTEISEIFANFIPHLDIWEERIVELAALRDEDDFEDEVLDGAAEDPEDVRNDESADDDAALGDGDDVDVAESGDEDNGYIALAAAGTYAGNPSLTGGDGLSLPLGLELWQLALIAGGFLAIICIVTFTIVKLRGNKPVAGYAYPPQQAYNPGVVKQKNPDVLPAPTNAQGHPPLQAYNPGVVKQKNPDVLPTATNAQSHPPQLSNACDGCGNPFPNSTAQFCPKCGTHRQL